MDKLNFEIADIIDKKGRISNRDIASLLGVNEKTVRNRLGRMIERGYIRFSAMLDIEEFPEVYIGITAINLRKSPDIVLPKIKEIPSVLFAFSVTGRFSALAVIIIKSHKDLSKITKNIDQTDGVTNVETFIVIDNYGLEIPASFLYELMNGNR